MHSRSHQSYVSSNIGTLVVEEARNLLRPPFTTYVLMLVVMLIMVIGALAVGAWWDGLSTGRS